MSAPDENPETQYVHRDDTETQFPTDVTGQLRQATQETHKVEDVTAETPHPLSTSSTEFIEAIAPDQNSQINTNEAESAKSFESEKPLINRSLTGGVTMGSSPAAAVIRLRDKRLGQLGQEKDKAA